MPLELLSPHRLFWRENPALLLGISLLLGTSSFLYSLSLFFPLLWLAYLSLVGFQSLFRGVCFLVLGVGYALFLYGSAPQLEQPRRVEGIFAISSLKPHQSPFQKGLMYKGTLRLPEEIPCSVCLNGEMRPLADCDYWIAGTLDQRGPYEYSLKLKEWRPIGGTWSFAEKRYLLKEKFRGFLQRSISSPQGASLLGSLITGDVEDRSLRYEFSRVGLQHLLSISGFHFAVLLVFCSGFLGLFLPDKIKIWTLLFALGAYFVFVGSAPAVLRSFITAVLYLTGKLLRRQPCGVNLLGCSMLFETILNPLAGAEIGFQLSFVSCGGLLLLFPLFERGLQRFLPKRSLADLAGMTPLSPYGYLISAYLRKGVALTLAVNIALLPLLLYHFHAFPLLGLLYNLFFPFCVSIGIFALLSGLIAHLVWEPLGRPILWATDLWTSQLIDLVSYPPLFLDRSIRCAHIPDWACLLYTFSIFLLIIHLRKRWV